MLGSGFRVEFAARVCVRVWGQSLDSGSEFRARVWVRVWDQSLESGSEFGVKVWGQSLESGSECGSEFGVKSGVCQCGAKVRRLESESESRLPQAKPCHGFGSKSEFGARVWSLLRVEGQSLI